MSVASPAEIMIFQKWLNEKGATLEVDGNFGPKSRQAMLQIMACKDAPAISELEIVNFAARLGVTVPQLRAVEAVESAGAGWDKSGLLTCLYERHFLWRRIRVAVPFLSNPTPGGYTIDADGDGINDSWEKLADATAFWGPGIALECASFGKFQVMGAHWKKLGYPSVLDFVWSQTRTEAAHFEVLCRYVEVFNLKKAMARISGKTSDCTAFAVGYNGPKQKGYDERIAKAFIRASR